MSSLVPPSFSGSSRRHFAIPAPSVGSVEAEASVGIRMVMRDTVKAVSDPHVTGILVASGLRTFVRGMWLAIAVIASLRFLHAGMAGRITHARCCFRSLAAVPVSAMLIGRPGSPHRPPWRCSHAESRSGSWRAFLDLRGRGPRSGLGCSHGGG